MEGDLLTILEGTWIDNIKHTEYKFFMDGTYEENNVYAIFGGSILKRRHNHKNGKIINLLESKFRRFGFQQIEVSNFREII